jgi:hypothetical protein
MAFYSINGRLGQTKNICVTFFLTDSHIYSLILEIIEQGSMAIMIHNTSLAASFFAFFSFFGFFRAVCLLSS